MSDKGQTIGYFYEFDCKPLVKLDKLNNNWLAVAFEKQVWAFPLFYLDNFWNFDLSVLDEHIQTSNLRLFKVYRELYLANEQVKC